MKPTTLIVSVLALTGTVAFAQEATPDDWLKIGSTKSRAEVQAELQQARQDGTMRRLRAGYNETINFSKARAQVAAETIAAQQSGELAAINGEVYAFERVPPVRVATTKN